MAPKKTAKKRTPPKKKPATTTSPTKQPADKKPRAKAPKKLPVKTAYEPPHAIPSVVPDGGLAALLRLPQGPVDLSTHGSRHKLGFPSKKGKDDAANLKLDMLPRLTELQERLFAAGRTRPDTAPRLLLLLQGMDTSGKGGVIRHAVGMVDPQGVDITSFKSPTPEELEHDFLWRIGNAVPAPGQIGVFDRSQYEDVLIVRVEELVAESEWESRYERINQFEAELTERGITLIKCFLNVSFDRQKERLMERLERPDKYWKYNEGDLTVRARWPEYMAAYEDALERCNTEAAPWYVIPADRKWYRNWAVAQLLLEHLEALELTWPEADYDVEEQKKKLAAS